jgi:catechol 2,3-dioxygenase-like lactoylglutathione lyase family enzyme
MSQRRAHFILYVRDQRRSRDFYERVLGIKPDLDVPGMTELTLATGAVLGLMPAEGIVRLLGPEIDPRRLHGGARAELYLVVDDPAAHHARALAAGARELSPLLDRDWGHRAAYSLDLDEHVLAFACPIGQPARSSHLATT